MVHRVMLVSSGNAGDAGDAGDNRQQQMGADDHGNYRHVAARGSNPFA